jgi:hypothetical protein
MRITNTEGEDQISTNLYTKDWVNAGPLRFIGILSSS